MKMTKRTLLAKGGKQTHRNQIQNAIRDLLDDLDVKAEITGVIADRWLQIDISGEDEGVATNYVSREIGFCPENIQKVSRFAVLKGYMTSPENHKEELTVDIGIFEPQTINAKIPLSHLQAQLADGKALELKKITELYGFGKDLPVMVKAEKIDTARMQIEAGLATEQILKYRSWIESLLDRLIVIGASSDDIKGALKHTGLWRDVIDIETLGIFEHALTCKLGTDAVGLISVIGRNLRNARIISFNARKAMESFPSLKT